MRRVTGRRRAAIVGTAVVVALSLAVLAVVVIPRRGQQGEPSAPAVPRFIEEANSAGLHHVYDGEFMHFIGGGVAVFDCDGDGRQDLYLAGGSEPAAMFRNASPVGGALQFERVAGASTDLRSVVGAYPLDVDGDDIMDLAVLRVGASVLLRGTGECAFERANRRWGYRPADVWTAAFSATWETADSLPTLAFGNYLKPESVADRTYVCDDNTLLRPNAAGSSYAAPITLAPAYCTLSVLFSDWDRSGRRDLRVSNDRHYSPIAREQLWRIASGETPHLWSRDEGWQPLSIWGMGIASYDVTGDGYPEIYLTSQADNKLQTLADGASQPRYEDIAIRRGATAHKPYTGDVTMRSTAWHAEFQDVNNDGLIDLFVSKGNVEAMTEYAARDPSNLLIGQPDGSFVEGGMQAGIVSFARARGAALADLNLDGLLDLVVVNRRVNVSLWRNVGGGTADYPEPMGDWIALQLKQDGANVDAIGAWVEVVVGDRTIRREVTVGGGHAGGQLGWIHFGIGDAQVATVTVTWPDGEIAQPVEVAANTFALVQRGSASAMTWQPEAE